MTKLWVCGRSTRESWDILGVYSTREGALRRCRGLYDFIAPINLDEDAPEEEVPWPGVEYPHQ